MPETFHYNYTKTDTLLVTLGLPLLILGQKLKGCDSYCGFILLLLGVLL